MAKQPQKFIELSPAELGLIEMYRHAEWDGGFQRAQNQNRVDQIAEKAKSGVSFAAPQLVEVAGHELEGMRAVRGMFLIVVDGQHRTLGHIQAGIPLTCQILLGRDLEEARRLYLLHNTTMAPVTTVDMLSASQTPVALGVKGLMADYGGLYNVGRSQIHSLARGAFRSAKRGYMDAEIVFGEDDLARIEETIKAMSAHPWWYAYDSHNRGFSSLRAKAACSTSFLEVLGRVAKTLDPDEVAGLVAAAMSRPSRFDSSQVFGKNLKQKRDLENALLRSYNSYRSSLKKRSLVA